METAVAAPLFKKRGPKASQIRKRPATPLPAASDSESGYTSTEDEGRRIKRRKKTAIVTANSKDTTINPTDLSATKYAADHTASLATTDDATKASDWYEPTAPTSKHPPPGTILTNPSDDTYKGRAAYPSFTTPNPDKPSKLKTVGPVKAASNVRMTTYTDFAPDVCKDYKQTGSCGFGDGCIYLHSREDYKQGWELDRDWEKVGPKGGKIDGRRDRGGGGGGDKKSTLVTEDMDSEEEEKALENIPFACVICREGYKMPVVTKCGHYFCEGCALKRYKRNPVCATCGAGTGGVFNGAKQLKRLLERKKERGRRRRERALAAGEEVSEEEGVDNGSGE